MTEITNSAGLIDAHFTAALTHAFRSRLNAILGSLELVNQTVLSKEQSSFVSTAIEEGRSLLYLVNDALDLGRIDAGQLHLEDASMDPVAIAEAALGTVSASYHERNIAATCIIDPQTPVSLRGDGLRLRQVLVNLLDNARNSAGTHAVQLSVGLHPEDQNGTRLMFQVRDIGGGVPEALRGKIFEPVLPKNLTDDWRMSSLGLGMALCARFVAMMGGQIAYEARQDGSVFSFDVQLKRDSNFARLADRIAPARASRVLLVDADATRRVAFATQARSWGIKVAVVPDFERARAALGTGHAFDLVLLHQNVDRVENIISAAQGQRIAILVPVGSAARPELETLGAPLMWLSAPLRSMTLIDAILGKKLPPIDLPEMDGAKGTSVRVKVLVVEDSEANRLVMRAQLERLNCIVETVENGAAAIRLVGQHRFDLVLTDLALPDMSGLEVASRIRRLSGELGKVPIVAVTGGVHPQDRDRCLAAGMNGYLTKPLSKKDLTELLDRYVQKNDAKGSLFDAAVLERLSDELGTDMQSDVLTAFERELIQRLGLIINETNPRVVGAQAHALKSAANAFGAESLGAIAKQLEALCEAPGLQVEWQNARRDLVRVGKLTLTELSNWLDADAGGVRDTSF